jgi:FKBP-type peptidyl-prolyl cis-trans isomerase FkpA
MRIPAVLFLLAVIGCSRDPEGGKRAAKPFDERPVRDQFMNANRLLLQKESDEMDAYARSHRLPVVTSSSGIKYFVYAPSTEGDSIREGMTVTMDYTVSLLDGTVCYSSATEGARTFEIGHADVETGIHRGLQYLKRGDKAVMMLPSSLAHGLLGDMKKIPPQSPVIYDLHVR